jgi:hypothetical protein
MDDLISSAEAGKILGVTPRAVRWYYQNDHLPGREIAGRLLFLRGDVKSFVKPKKTGRPKKATPDIKPAKPASKKKKKG